MVMGIMGQPFQYSAVHPQLVKETQQHPSEKPRQSWPSETDILNDATHIMSSAMAQH